MTRLSIEESVDRATTIAREVVARNAVRVDEAAEWPEEAIRALLDAGLGGLVVPVEDGGHGHGLLALARVSEALGREGASTALCFAMHCVGSAVMAARPTSAQRTRYLKPIAQGRHLTTLTLSEPGTGAHFWLPRTRLEHAGEDLVVTGAKTFVTSGGHADSYVVSAVRHDSPASVGEFSCVVVDAETEGLEWGDPWDGFGMRGNSSRSLRLEGVRLRPDAVLGEPGDQIWYVFNVVAPYFLVAMAGAYFGVAVGAFEEARRHVVERRYDHDGSRLAEQPVIQHHVGEMWARLERTRQLVHHAAQLGDRGHADALPALAAAKAEVADCAVGITNDAMTLVGGIGYREHGSLGRRLRDARAAHVMSPTTDLLRLWTGRAVLGEHLLGE